MITAPAWRSRTRPQKRSIWSSAPMVCTQPCGDSHSDPKSASRNISAITRPRSPLPAIRIAISTPMSATPLPADRRRATLCAMTARCSFLRSRRKIFGRDGWECPAILKALDGCDELYFDSVSQIRMPSWTAGRVTLVGDACSCPSLLAGQGTSLAMGAAYILAGELKKAAGDYRVAFETYEEMLQPVMAGKQRAAVSFAGSFAPKTRLGIFIRNELTRLMTQPSFAKLFIGRRLLTDPLALPNYD
jgi:2-polyprenyl-6-methoxyphenol hydroxylase-like FAD-dependent oxidoreductase